MVHTASSTRRPCVKDMPEKGNIRRMHHSILGVKVELRVRSFGDVSIYLLSTRSLYGEEERLTFLS